MTNPPRFTRAQSRIIKTVRPQLRRVTKAERMAHPDRFSPKGAYLVPKSIKKVTARTAFVTETRWEDIRAGVSHTKASKERAAGKRPYLSAASEAQAAQAKRTFLIKRLKRKLENTPAGTIVIVQKRKKIKGRRGNEYYNAEERLSEQGKERYFEFRQQKLSGEWIEEGDWHEMMTAARAINDPMLSALLKSP
jgi:hypothetical protein